MSVIKPMVSNVARWLRIGGAVAVEHDDTNGARLQTCSPSVACSGEVAEHPDLAGRPRFVVALRVPTDVEAQRTRATRPVADETGTDE